MNWHKIVGPYSNPDVVLPSDRDTCQAFVLPTKQARLWIVGGYGYGNVARREILYAADRSNFQFWSYTTPWEPFSRATMHNDKIVAVDRNHVWRVDGYPPASPNFVQVAASPTSVMPDVVSWKGQLHLFDTTGYRFSADDGVTWSSPTPLQWGADKEFDVKVCNGALVALVWSRFAVNTPPEISYPAQTTLAKMFVANELQSGWVEIDCPFRPRRWPAFSGHLGSIYIFGGFNPWIVNGPSQANMNDLWRYEPHSGAWQKIVTTTTPAPRHGAELVSDEDGLILYGGNAGPVGAPYANTLFDGWVLS